MAPARVVPSFDDDEERHAGLGLGLELALLQFAFQRGEEALAERLVVGVGVADAADRSA